MERIVLYNIVSFLIFLMPQCALGQGQIKKTIQIPWQDSTLEKDQVPAIGKNLDRKPATSFKKVIPLKEAPSDVEINPTFTFQKPTHYYPDSFQQTLPSQFNIDHKVAYQEKHPYLIISLEPIRKEQNHLTFLQTLLVKVTNHQKSSLVTAGKRQENEWPSQSVLASGNWYKLAVDTTGVFRINTSFLKKLGLNPDNINPENIHIFGSGGAMLPQSFSKDYPKGLRQIPVEVMTNGNGKMDGNDKILFFGKGPTTWHYEKDNGQYKHSQNDYSEKGYYYLTVDKSRDAKQIDKQPSLNNAPYATQKFDQLFYHEKEQFTEINENVKTGRNWFGEVFDRQLTHSFDVNLNSEADSLTLYYRLANRSSSGNVFRINFNGDLQKRFSIGGLGDDLSDYESNYINVKSGKLQQKSVSENLNISLTYNKTGNDKGWLDYLNLSARTKLQFNGNPMQFRDRHTLNFAKARYNISNVSQGLKIWDVTNQWKVHKQALKQDGGGAYFIDSSMVLRDYLAFEPGSTFSPNPKGKVKNQNLHGLSPAKMIIVSHKDFIQQAKELAKVHKKRDSFSVQVVTPSAIYQEFSSGRDEITGIRNFIKMLYDRADSDTNRPQYLLLFGDASYDYKDRIKDNTDLVPTYQSKNAYSPLASYATDDYYGFLDDNEGSMNQFVRQNASHRMDLAIGRIPANTQQHAETVVQKIKQYHKNPESFGKWQNKVTFVADDEDDVIHFKQSEDLVSMVNNQSPVFNPEKIYLDAYQQKTKAGGTRYPDARQAINDRINKGSLIFTYIGHGGERGLAHEKVLQLEDIASWNNGNKLPLFVTATCEFSRFDDPNFISAGERVLFKKNGGGIGLLTTTRLVLISDNGKLNRKVFNKNILEKENGEYPRLGDIFLKTKRKIDQQNPGSRGNTRRFALLGDPALKLAYPKKEVKTTAFNSEPFSPNDTFKSLQEVTLEGKVTNDSGQVLDGFNGKINTTIFDKKVKLKTRGNDQSPQTFKARTSRIYEGKVDVNNGRFKVNFVVPKDIAYTAGKGKISYYANDKQEDANGYSFINIGGTADNPISDDQPPEVDLYLNDKDFKDGGITSQDPLVLATVDDDYGINTAANGVGHQPKLILNNDNTWRLSDAFEASEDSNSSGTIRHQLRDLPTGRHFLKLKVWDVANNVGEDKISFIVKESEKITIEELLNYPNPFSDKTRFAFEHNQDGKKLDITLKIYDSKGALQSTIRENIQPEGNRYEGITWNGRNQNGEKLKDGVYLYQLVIRNQQGDVQHSTNKLVIQK